MSGLGRRVKRMEQRPQEVDDVLDRFWKRFMPAVIEQLGQGAYDELLEAETPAQWPQEVYQIGADICNSLSEHDQTIAAWWWGGAE